MTPAPLLLGVSCDGEDPTSDYWDCENMFEADFLVGDQDNRDTRLGYVLDHVAAYEGWKVVGRQNPSTALTFCPSCAPQAREL